jgi:hypothetical protein
MRLKVPVTLPRANVVTGFALKEPLDGLHTFTPAEEGNAQVVAATAVPVSEMTRGLSAAESVMVSEPVRVPVVVGWNETLIVQLVPGKSVVPQFVVLR